jgi:hypothetical protein
MTGRYVSSDRGFDELQEYLVHFGKTNILKDDTVNENFEKNAYFQNFVKRKNFAFSRIMSPPPQKKRLYSENVCIL